MFSAIEQLCRLFPKENANGLLREYFPKKTDLAVISDEDLNKALFDINHRPRKCLAYRTACEALEDEFKYMLHLFLQFIIYKNMYFSFINLLYFITKTH